MYFGFFLKNPKRHRLPWYRGNLGPYCHGTVAIWAVIPMCLWVYPKCPNKPGIVFMHEYGAYVMTLEQCERLRNGTTVVVVSWS